MRTIPLGGFADPAADAARAFRTALSALSRPGTILPIQGGTTPAPLSPAARLLLVLADGTTPLWLAPSHDLPLLRDWITFHIGAPLTRSPDQAVFALGTWEALQPVSRFEIGRPDYPDRSATLIVEVETLTPFGARLSGPGIDGTAHLNLPEIAAFRNNHALYPQGFDCFFTTANAIAALPRSTKVEAL